MKNRKTTITLSSKRNTAVTRPLAAEDLKQSSSPQARLDLDAHQDFQITGTVGLSTLLAPLMTYLQKRGQADDLDMLIFCLHHLFYRQTTLYLRALPGLSRTTQPIAVGLVPPGNPATCEQIWLHLQLIHRSLERIESLCYLLNRTIEQLLADLDQTSQPSQAPGTSSGAASVSERWPQSSPSERWEPAFNALAESVAGWQESFRQVTPFAAQFLAIPLQEKFAAFSQPLVRLDQAFTLILEGAGAIFGDILLSFRGITTGADEVAAILLFDLAQQADQFLFVYDTIREPLNILVASFAVDLLLPLDPMPNSV